MSLDYIFNYKSKISSKAINSAPMISENIKRFTDNKLLLEIKLLFIDLLKELSDILASAIYKSGYNDFVFIQIYSNSLEYLQEKINQFRHMRDSEQIERISNAILPLKTILDNALLFMEKEEGVEEIKKILEKLNIEIKEFKSFIEMEADSTRDQLIKINQLLVEDIKTGGWVFEED